MRECLVGRAFEIIKYFTSAKRTLCLCGNHNMGVMLFYTWGLRSYFAKYVGSYSFLIQSFKWHRLNQLNSAFLLNC